MTTILGVSALYHDSAAAVVRDGRILAAAQEERFSRRKHDPRFPTGAIDFCLADAGGADAIDAIAFYEDPVLTLDRNVKNAIDMAPASAATWRQASLSQLVDKADVMSRLARAVGERAAQNLFVVDHHMSHLASAFYPSPFEDAAVVVADGVGEWATTTIADGQGRTIAPLRQIAYPHSLGLFYSAVTYHCGMKVNSGEYKLMGLAPFGEPRYVRLILDNLIRLRDDGSFALNTEYFGFLTSEFATSEKFGKLFDLPRRLPDSRLSLAYMDLAASAQVVLEQAMLRIGREALRLTGRRQLCLAGGVALNCVANGKLWRELPGLDGLWIQPAAGDAGGALGAALYVDCHHYGSSRHAAVGHFDGQSGSLLGPEFSPEEMERALRGAGIVFRSVADEEARNREVAEALADGKIVGRFDGRMEFGPRALGNRSILADARRPEGQRDINIRIKFRESWRPFAPVVLAERAADFFAMTGESPYMLLVADVREELRQPTDWTHFRDGDADMLQILNQRRSSLPGVTHVDYSARVQTVDAHRNPPFHRLLRQFEAITGCPVLINTSFNVRGEPIVCSPDDAVRCFINAGIDLLAIGPFLAYKHEQSDELKSQHGSTLHEPD